MRENRISVFRKHTLGILVALGMVLFGSVFILLERECGFKEVWVSG